MATTTVISVAGGYDVTSSGDATIANLRIENSSAILDIAAGTFSILGTHASVTTGTIDIGDGATLVLGGLMVDSSSIGIGSTGDATTLKIHGDVALRGYGEVTLNGSGAELLSDGSPARLVTYTTMAGSGMIGDADLTLINRGVIVASGTDPLAIETAKPVVNEGTIEATSTGGLSILHNLINNGSLAANGGNITIGGSLIGSGSDSIANATLEIARGVSAGQSVLFYGSGTLTLDVAQSFAGTVSGFDTADSIDLANFGFAANPTIASVSSTMVHGISAVEIKITDRTLTATIDLLNQAGASYSMNPSAYEVVSDNNSANGHPPGTMFALAGHTA